VIPVASIQHKPTGIGVNFIAIPHIDYGSRGYMPAVVFGQLTKSF
jgi:mannitol/fructose-specific phosphotransferase system IIA component (Ntr-type)